jgi:hypothetical protein
MDVVGAGAGTVSSAPAWSTRSDDGVCAGSRAAKPKSRNAVVKMMPNQTRRRDATDSFTRCPPFEPRTADRFNLDTVVTRPQPP